MSPKSEKTRISVLFPFSLIIAMFGASCAIPTTTGFQATAETPKSDSRSSFVWKVTGPSNNTIYLAGSIHLLTRSDHPLPPTYDAAYSDSDSVYFEAPMQQLANSASRAALLQKATYPEGKTLKNSITSSTYAQLEAYCKANGLNPATFDNYKPWMVAISLMQIEYKALGASADLGVESRYFRKAKRDGKVTGGLESPSSQLGIFERLTPARQESFLLYTLNNLEKTKPVYRKIVNAWKRGDLATVQNLYASHARKYPQINSMMLTSRNKKWLGKIEGIINSGKNSMVIVGAAHLVGSGNLRTLLRGKGYKIEQIRY